MIRGSSLKNSLLWVAALAALSSVFVLFLLPLKTSAQATAPQFLITWKTSGSYVPALYPGKALPTYGSKITASFELVSSGGKIVSVKNQTIYWYLNDILLGGGTGVQRVTFSPLGTPPNTMSLKIELPDYNGGYLINTVSIPMVAPQAVVYSPYPGGQFSKNPVVLDALPYFFNIPDASTLSYQWSVNGQTGSNTENPNEADISLPANASSGSALAVSLTITNPLDSTSANGSTNLIYKPQP